VSRRSANGSAGTELLRCGSVLAYDSQWQFPAITEQHAFDRALGLIPDVPGLIYFGFPWATYFDLANNSKEEGLNHLQKVLSACQVLTRGMRRVATVCQHIHLLRYQQAIADTGITDVFWSHASVDLTHLPDYPSVSVHPFPLYPVQAIEPLPQDIRRDRLLFSFVGARANEWYLTDSRDLLIDLLGGHPDGCVVARDNWHYNRIVYDHQISRLDIGAQELVDVDASQEFRRIMAESTFSLCPSGSGPNSIRLWESIGLGSIPVVLSDRYAHPGEDALWHEAVVTCGENEADIMALPARLAELAKDREGMERRRHALRQLWHLYGPEIFIYDIQKWALRWSAAAAAPQLDQSALHRLATEYLNGSDSRGFVLGIISRLLVSPDSLLEKLNSLDVVHTALSKALGDSQDPDVRRLRQALRMQIERIPESLAQQL